MRRKVLSAEDRERIRLNGEHVSIASLGRLLGRNPTVVQYWVTRKFKLVSPWKEREWANITRRQP